MPKVSVIVPNYNHAAYLEQRIEGILNQTYQDFELILLDDCSTDNSIEILTKYSIHPKVTHFVINEQNGGSPFAQWKKGVSLAKGEYIWIAESDDYCEYSFLDTMVEHLNNNTNVGIAFCGSHWVDSSGRIKEDLSLFDKSFICAGLDIVKRYLLYYNIIQNVSSCLIRKTQIDLEKSFTIKMKSCGDWFFYSKLLIDCDLLFEQSKLNYYRWYHQNTSNSSKQNGLWTKEGMDIVWSIIKDVKLTKNERKSIVFKWLPEIKQSTISAKFKIIHYLRLFNLDARTMIKIFVK